MNTNVMGLLSVDYFSTDHFPTASSDFLFGNTLVGPIRMRQIRIQESPCSETQVKLQQDLDPSAIKCYGAWSLLQEDTTYTKGPGYVPPEDDAFVYRNSEETNEIPFYGKFGLYPPGGFLVDVTNQTIAAAQFSALEEDKWVDIKTRAVTVDFTVYNPNLVDAFSSLPG